MLLRSLLAMIAVLPGLPSAQAQNPVAAPPGGDLRVSIYGGGQALFAERRRATVTVGANELQLTGMPNGIVDGSPDIRVLSGPALRLLDQRITPATGRPSQALGALVGQTIRMVRHGPAGDQMSEGTLLTVTPTGAVAALQVGDRVVLDPEGEVQVTPEQLALLTRTAALVCHAQSEGAGEVELLVSYLVGDASWEAKHTVVLSEDAASMSLTSWATARVPGAAGMTAALRLVSGTFAGAGGVYVYSLDRQAVFGPAGEAQLTLAEAPRVPVTNLLLFDGGTLDQLAAEKPVSGPVARVMRFDDTPESGLGVAIPTGKAVVYQQAPDPGARLISQASMPGARNGMTVDLALGEVGGLQGASKQASWRQLSPEDIERKCEMVITNVTGADQIVTCGVTLSGKWTITEASHEYTNRAPNRVEFTVPVPAAEKAVSLTYTVRIEVPPEGGEAPEGDATAPPVPANEPE